LAFHRSLLDDVNENAHQPAAAAAEVLANDEAEISDGGQMCHGDDEARLESKESTDDKTTLLVKQSEGGSPVVIALSAPPVLPIPVDPATTAKTIESLEEERAGFEAARAACLKWLGDHYQEQSGSCVVGNMEAISKTVSELGQETEASDSHNGVSQPPAKEDGVSDVPARAQSGEMEENGNKEETEEEQMWSKWVADPSLWLKLARCHLGFWGGANKPRKAAAVEGVPPGSFSSFSASKLEMPQPVLCVDMCAAALLRLPEKKGSDTQTVLYDRQRHPQPTLVAKARAEARYMQVSELSTVG
jgi:hypothetical protein